MGRMGLAFRAFFRVFSDEAFSQKVKLLIEQPTDAIAELAVGSKSPPALAIKAAPRRSDALTLLGVLQREARLIDFLKEDIAGYTDDQVGSAVREIHRDSAKALDRLFGLRPIRKEAEGAGVTLAAGFDAGRIRLVGNVTGAAPHSDTLVHAGWEATTLEIPEWNGTEGAARVVAPAEVELK